MTPNKTDSDFTRLDPASSDTFWHDPDAYSAVCQRCKKLLEEALRLRGRTDNSKIAAQKKTD
jgi:hypothetical protein